MTRKLNRWRFPKQARLKEKKPKILSFRYYWLIALLSWLTLASFCFTIPPRLWWQITVGILLFFTSLFLTAQAASQSLSLSLAIASLITLLPVLKILGLLTPAILALIVLVTILITGSHLL